MAVQDKKLAKIIAEKYGLQCDTSQLDLLRGVRAQLNHLVAGKLTPNSGFSEEELRSMTLGLAHGLARYTLKFSAEKVDIMIIQAISLSDELDKELNNYMMRLREWFGWHFPELSKIVTDNVVYAKLVKAIGQRNKIRQAQIGEIVPEEISHEILQAAEISMGTEISEQDEECIALLVDQILELVEYREELQNYLKNRMQTIAPNLSMIIGEVIGARLIQHAGSLLNLAKYPASTIQILGAEKALFRAIKSNKNTPKYGILFQSSIVGQAQQKNKGKISRSLAAKCSICVRCDALGKLLANQKARWTSARKARR